MNWKLRIKNKATLTAICVGIVGLVYQTCGIFGIVPPISESAAGQAVGEVINLLMLLGVVVDPTTAGIADSEQAQDYDEPAPKTKTV